MHGMVADQTLLGSAALVIVKGFGVPACRSLTLESVPAPGLIGTPTVISMQPPNAAIVEFCTWKVVRPDSGENCFVITTGLPAGVVAGPEAVAFCVSTGGAGIS